MKQTLFLLFMILSKVTFGQTFSFDRGNGKFEDLATAVTALELITQNKPHELFQHFSSKYKPDASVLEKACLYAYSNFPFQEGREAPCFCDMMGNEIWYERTYYKKGNNTIDYLFQVFIELEETSAGIKIIGIQFRQKESVIKREKEIAEMKKTVDINNPPPPPPPSGLPRPQPPIIDFKRLDNSKTVNHINIPSTRLFIIPPAGFKLSEAFKGLQNDDYTSIIIYDQLESDYLERLMAIQFGQFSEEDAKTVEYKDLFVNNFPAKLLHIKRRDSKNELRLGFGDSTFSTVIMAMYPSDEKDIESEIIQSFKTIYYDKNFSFSPLTSLPFTVDDSKSVLKFEKLMGGLSVYTIGGVEKQNYENEICAMFSTAPYPTGLTTKAVAALYNEKIKSLYEIEDDKIEILSEGDVNGFASYEVKMEGAVGTIYLMVVASSNTVVYLTGFLQNKEDKYLEDIRQFSRTIRIK